MTGTFVCLHCEAIHTDKACPVDEPAVHELGFCADNGETWRVMTTDSSFKSASVGQTVTVEGVAAPAVAVADHQPVAVLVADVGVPLNVRGDLGLQRRREHPAGTVADQLVEQRHRRRLFLRALLTNYREHYGRSLRRCCCL